MDIVIFRTTQAGRRPEGREIRGIAVVTTEKERLGSLFAHLVAGDTGGFLAGCASEMTLTARGVVDSSVIVRRRDVAAWYDGFDTLTGGTLRTAIESVVADAVRAVVVLRHDFVREGVARSYRTINFCTLRDDLLLAWFCHPATRASYAEAWGLVVPDDGRDRTAVPALHVKG
jgi:hypothetical protein